MNALLMEIMMAVLFLALSSAVILDLFAAAHMQSDLANARRLALHQAQNLSEQLYAAEDMDALLEASGFEHTPSGWHCGYENYVLLVRTDEEHAPAGSLMTATITAAQGDEVLADLPVSRYVPAEVER